MGRPHPQDKKKALLRRVSEIPDIDLCITCEKDIAANIVMYQEVRRTRFSDRTNLPKDYRVLDGGGIMLAESDMGQFFSDHIREAKGLFPRATHGVFVRGKKTPLKAQGVKVHPQVRAASQTEGEKQCGMSRFFITSSVNRASKIYSHRVLNRIIRSKDSVVLFFLALANTSEKIDSEVSFVDDYLISALRHIERMLSISHNRCIDTISQGSSGEGADGSVVGSRLVICDGSPGFRFSSRLIIGDMLFALLSGHASTSEEREAVRSDFVRTKGVSGFFPPVPVDRSAEAGSDPIHRDLEGESYVLLVAALGAMGPRRITELLPLLRSSLSIEAARWEDFLNNVVSSPELPLELLYNMQRKDR